MAGFLNFPNLPQGRLSLAAIGEGYALEMSMALEKYGVRLLSCPNNPFVDERLGSHIDLSVYHLGGSSFLFSKHAAESDFAHCLKEHGAQIIVSDKSVSQLYPSDAGLCALNIGGRVLHNSSFCDPIITAYSRGRLYHVSQGYAKCAVCPITENAAISADPGLSQAMRRQGIEVLEITPGFVDLYGFREGFIGGAAFKIAPDILAFTGSLHRHPDKTSILDFLKKHGIYAVYLTEKPVFDIGSVIPILEE